MHQTLIACHECDLLQRTPPLQERTVARCRRCMSLLYRPLNEDLDRPLAYTLAAAILFAIANAFPIVGLGTALWSFGGLLMMIAAAVASFDARVVWAKQDFMR